MSPYAQDLVVDDTQTINNTTQTLSGSDRVFVGLANDSTGTLTIENGGVLNNTGTGLGIIAQGSNSTGTVTVTGTGSSWTNAAGLSVGNGGAGTLNIENGGAVSSAGGNIGNFSGFTGTSTVTVTGPGSSWTNAGNLSVGSEGAGTLTIADGGAVSNVNGFIGGASDATGTATVTGADSSWTNSGDLIVGMFGAGTLNIENGGTVSAFESRIGSEAGSTGTVTVTGAGSSWAIEETFVVGGLGGGTLNITDGGTVSNNRGVIAGANGSTGTVTVSGAGSTWTNSGSLGVGLNGTGTLNIADGGAVSSTLVSIGDNAGSGTVTVTGAGSSWTNSGAFRVGGNGSGTLTIENGGTVSNSNVLSIVGDNSASTGTVTVAGAGSSWTNTGDLFVGRAGTGTLNVLNGAAVSVGDEFVLGFDPGGTGAATVSGSGSTLDAVGSLRVGAIGAGTLTIENGGTVSNTSARIGSDAGSEGTVTVTGTGSSWTNSDGVNVGHAGTGTLNIENGGTVSGTTANIAVGTGGSTGTATVTGPGSSWTASGFLLVGNGGTGTLTVENGGTMSSGSGQIGFGATGTATVTGAGSSLASSGDLFVGSGGAGTLNVLDGATTSSGADVILGINSAAVGTALVSGAGSMLQATNGILIGDAGAGTLTLADGGVVSAGSGAGTVTLAADAISTGTLNIGAAAGDAAVAAGTLNAASVEFGAGAGALNFNHTETDYDFDAAISGAGTLNLIAGVTNLTADSSGFTGAINVTGGALNITNQLGGGLAIIGISDGEPGTVTVTGAGASWANTDDLRVGDSGAGTLTIANGGAVSAGSGSNTVNLAINAGSTGTLNIGAAVGDAAVAAGTLNAATVEFGAGTGILNFNHTETGYDFDAEISGAGTLNQIAGVTNLSADSSSFAGNTDITGGALYVNNALGGAVNVTGGTLGGSGTLSGNVSVTNGAIGAGNSPGTLTIDGDLALASGSSLDFELGSPSGTAGVDGDLINVGGDLTLDGTLNVSNAGGFGSGLYRLVNYGGTLTDDGLDMGAAPSGFNDTNLTVQTATLGQVNLLVGVPLFSFWDGANTIANNAVDGGSGSWTATGDNWTIADGSSNGAFDPSVLLIFSGTPGTVTVDDSAGAIASQNGMQFAVDGYQITGDAIGLTGANAIRVGDGTAAGAGFTATIASNLTGAGSLDKTDLGTLILTGANTYTGGTTISAGTLIGNATSLQGDIVNNAALTFDQASAGTYAGIISGTGALTKDGAGELTLTGNSSAYAGTTNITAGLLTVNGSLGGAINMSGGALGGSGTLGNVTVAAGGTLAPGNSIGTLNVANITHDAGSTYTVELNDGGFVAGSNNDLVNATGTATIDGGIVHVTPENGTDSGSTYTFGTYTILTAAGGVTGTFDTLTDDYAFLDFALSYDPNNVFLTSHLAATSFCLNGMTANQCATGDGVFSRGAGSLFTAVLNLSNTEAPGALDQLSGEIHASAKTALIADSRFTREAALDRLRSALGGVAAANGAQAEQRVNDSASFWGQVFGSWGQWDGDGNAAELDRSIGGLLLGGDALVADDIRVGLMGGYSRSSFDIDDRLSSGTADTYTLGAYGGGEWDAFSLKGGAAYSWHSLDTSRSVAFTGFSNSLSASYDARSFQAYGEAAYGIDAGRARFEPFANLAHVHLNTAGYSETGGEAALTAAGQSMDSTFTTIGLRAQTQVDLGETKTRLSSTAGWRHAFGDVTPLATHAFTVAGVPVTRNAFVLDLGASVNLTEDATLGFSYNGQFGSGLTDQGLKANFAMRF